MTLAVSPRPVERKPVGGIRLWPAQRPLERVRDRDRAVGSGLLDDVD